MATHQIVLPNGFRGTVVDSQGTVTVDFPVGQLTGKIKRYNLDLTSPTNKKIEFELHKDPNGNWWDSWFLPVNPDADKNLIALAKTEIDKMGI